MTVYEDALKLHELHHGKLSIEPKVPATPEDLTLAYAGRRSAMSGNQQGSGKCLPLYRQGATLSQLSPTVPRCWAQAISARSPVCRSWKARRY